MIIYNIYKLGVVILQLKKSSEVFLQNFKFIDYCRFNS